MPTIRQRGEKFQSIVRIKRGGIIIHQETRTFGSDKLARDWGERLEARIASEGVPQRQTSQSTLSALLRRYTESLQAHGAIRRTRIMELNQLAAEFSKPEVGLSGLSASVFSEFAVRRRKAGAGAATVLHNLSTLRSVLNAAKPMYGLSVTGAPVAEAISALNRLGITERSNRRERRPTSDEMSQLAAEFQRISIFPSTVLPMETIIAIAVEFPRRLSELMNMKWTDYNKKGHTIVLRGTKNPTRPRDETVPVSAEAARIMDALPVIDERMLPYKSESASAAFQRACTRLGIVDLHFHDLRHEGITRMFERGLTIPEVSLVSGHLDWAMLKRYTHPSVTALSEKLNAGTRT